jgi:hypothetical protein
MKKLLILFLLILPALAFGQNIRIQQLRSTGEPLGRIVITDGDGSFEFSDNSYLTDSTSIATHLENDDDTLVTNELIDSIRTDSVFLIIYEGGNAVGDSINLDSMFYENTKIDSLLMVGDTLKFYVGGDTISYDVVVDFTNYWSKTEITEADTTRYGTLQTATETSVADTAGYYDSDNVEQVLREIGEDVASAGDNWGSQTVVSDSTLTGPGVTGDSLRVNPNYIQTLIDLSVLPYQTMDTVQLTGTNLELSLENDGEAKHVVDLSSLQDGTGTDDQTATEVGVTDAGDYYDGENVEAVLQEIGSDIATSGDNWGSQTVVSDTTLTGGGVTGDTLRVDLTRIASISWVNNQDFLTEEVDGSISNELITSVTYSDDTLAITEAGTTRKVEIAASSGGITALTGEVTASGTGSVTATIADDVVAYSNVSDSLKSTTTNNTLTWDISGSGIINCTPSTGTVSFTNAQVNKSITVVLVLSSATITWPATAKIIDGSATLGDGTFYVYIHCISSSIFTVSITKEAT